MKIRGDLTPRVLKHARDWIGSGALAKSAGVTLESALCILAREAERGNVERKRDGGRWRYRATQIPDRPFSAQILEEADGATTSEIAAIVGCSRRMVDTTLRQRGWRRRIIMLHDDEHGQKRRHAVWSKPETERPG